MEQKDIIAIVLLFIAFVGSVTVCSASHRLRDFFFMALVLLAAVTERVDVNFVSRDWYRGTTRGFEVSLVDIIALSLLISSIVFPRRGIKRWFWPGSLGPMLVFFAYAGLCVVMADPKLYGYFQLTKMMR